MHVQTEHYDEPHTYGPGDFFKQLNLLWLRNILRKNFSYPFQEKCRI